jgi:hypothetical protein
MSKNLIVRLTALALMLTLPVAAFAQTSRVEGLALQGDYVKDYTGIFTYLSSVSTVGNLVYGELGTNVGGPTPADRSMGAVLGNLWDGRYGTWGIHLRQQTSQLGQGDQTSGSGVGVGRDPNSNFNESFDLMWGKKLTNTNLGLRINRSFRKDKMVTGGVTTNLEFDNAVGNNNLGRNIVGYGAGLGFEMNQNTSVELSGLLESRSFENSVTPPGTSNKDDGGTSYQFAGRMMWQWTPSVMVTPVIKIYNFLQQQALGLAGRTRGQLDGGHERPVRPRRDLRPESPGRGRGSVRLRRALRCGGDHEADGDLEPAGVRGPRDPRQSLADAAVWRQQGCVPEDQGREQGPGRTIHPRGFDLLVPDEPGRRRQAGHAPAGRDPGEQLPADAGLGG